MNISFVLPVYNVEQYLVECIDSILNQTVSAYEIILIDDGSTDGSGQICDEYAEKNDLIKVIHKKNAGLGMARNTGIENASGDYIVFIDSDDYIANDYIEYLQNELANKDLDFIKAGLIRVDDDGNQLSSLEFEDQEYSNEKIRFELIPRMIGSAPDKKDSIPMSSCFTAYRLEIIRHNNLKFKSERDVISEDIVFNIEYLSFCKKVFISSYSKYYYRVNYNSLSTSYRADRFEKCIELYNLENQLLRQIGIETECQYRLDRQFFIYIKMCIKQLKIIKNKIGVRCTLEEIDKITSNETVNGIARRFPKLKMGLVRGGFVYMLQYRLNFLLYLLFCL